MVYGCNETGTQNRTEQTPDKPGLFKRLAARLQPRRLGDLLVSGGLITQDQLDAALAHQRRNGGQLGAILVSQGALSAAALRGKLRQQMVLRFCAAAISFVMSTSAMVPAQARADQLESESTVQVALASMNDLSSLKQAPLPGYPSLFGSREVRSTDISAFSKWSGVFDRYDDQLRKAGNDGEIRNWKNELNRLVGKDLMGKIEAVNAFVNQQTYLNDKRNWSMADHWATPIEFFGRGGDCEDYAIAKYMSLRALGVPDSRMRIAVVKDTLKNIPHAILVVYTDDGAMILDNQAKRVKDARKVSRYKPIFSINKSGWWRHKV